jgi:Serine hydroxymethyltransferase
MTRCSRRFAGWRRSRMSLRCMRLTVRLAPRREMARAVGGTAISRTIDFAGFAEIAREVGAILVVDIAHIAGAGGWWGAPISGGACGGHLDHDPQDAGGPRGAMLLWGTEHAQALDRAVFPGLQGPARPHHRGDRGGAARGRAAAVPPLRRADRRQRQAAGAGARRAGLRPGVRRHRQPPAADRPDQQGGRGQAGRAGPGPCRAGRQLQHRPLRPAQAVQPVRYSARDPPR